jgi:hypothetical protein
MTIQFNCPNCDAIIAFHDKHRGKRARCLNCGQLFIVPSKDNQTPQKLEPKIEKPQVLPGFYRALFLDSWKIFINPQNATGLVFVAAAVCFKFFTGHTDYSFDMGERRSQAPTGLIVTIAAWGCLFWYYMEIIHSTAFEDEQLPDVYMGGLFGFVWNIIKSVFLFAIALVIVLIPCIISLAILRKPGAQLPLLSHILAIAGLFVFPMAILTLSVGREATMLLRPDYLLRPIVRAFWPYLVPVALFILAWQLQLWAVDYGKLLHKPNTVVALHLLGNLGVQVIAIIAMRSIGLFYRHHSCHFPW